MTEGKGGPGVVTDERLQGLRETQLATLNILDDFNAEKQRLEDSQRAVLNILDDFNEEKSQLQSTQRAAFNILDDFSGDRLRLEDTQKALLNILDDLNQSREELQRAHDALELRVKERTAELQQRTHELESANRDLEASNRELESFSYSVSHDLRAPLRSMDGFSLALMEDYGDKLDSQAQDYLGYIRSSAQLMGRLIDDILNLSRITRAEIHLDQVDVTALASEVAAELRRAQPDRNVEFVITPGLEIFADRDLLKLVLDNLMGNAFKFTSRRPEARIEVGVVDGNEGRAFFVWDNGVGFDMAYSHKLFKPFQRLHRPEEFSGTGIGLASVQRIISRLGGQVSAEGETGKGATFFFSLPRR